MFEVFCSLIRPALQHWASDAKFKINGKRKEESQSSKYFSLDVYINVSEGLKSRYEDKHKQKK